MLGGRYWVRTSDLFGVNEARYHCANRPCGALRNISACPGRTHIPGSSGTTPDSPWTQSQPVIAKPGQS